jgi:hypothetical protein
MFACQRSAIVNCRCSLRVLPTTPVEQKHHHPRHCYLVEHGTEFSNRKQVIGHQSPYPQQVESQKTCYQSTHMNAATPRFIRPRMRIEIAIKIINLKMTMVVIMMLWDDSWLACHAVPFYLCVERPFHHMGPAPAARLPFYPVTN